MSKRIRYLAAALALGGDCLADIAVLREQPALAGACPVLLRAWPPDPGEAHVRRSRLAGTATVVARAVAKAAVADAVAPALTDDQIDQAIHRTRWPPRYQSP